MPRGGTRLEEALLQRRLWTPREHPSGGAWYRLSDPTTLSFSGANVTGARDLLGRHDVTVHPGGTVPYQAAFGEMAFLGSLPLFNNQAQSYFRATSIAGGPLATATGMCMVALCRGPGGGSRGVGAVRVTGDDNSPFWPAPFSDFAHRSTDAFLTNFTATVNVGVPADTWFLWSQEAGVSDGSTAAQNRAYRNGALIASANGSMAVTSGALRLHVGQASQNQATENWSGQIAEIIWLAAPTQRDRQRAEGLVAWWHRRPDLLHAAHPYRNTPPLIGG